MQVDIRWALSERIHLLVSTGEYYPTRMACTNSKLTPTLPTLNEFIAGVVSRELTLCRYRSLCRGVSVVIYPDRHTQPHRL